MDTNFSYQLQSIATPCVAAVVLHCMHSTHNNDKKTVKFRNNLQRDVGIFTQALAHLKHANCTLVYVYRYDVCKSPVHTIKNPIITNTGVPLL